MIDIYSFILLIESVRQMTLDCECECEPLTTWLNLSLTIQPITNQWFNHSIIVIELIESLSDDWW